MVRWWYYPLTKNWSGMLLIPLFMLALTAYAVFMIYRKNKNMGNESQHEDSIELLNREVFQVEIDEEEYRRRKEALLRRL
jgi:uncharacterized membrane protein